MDDLAVILEEIETVMELVDRQAITSFARFLVAQEGRIFVLGEGRSGFMAKAFAMRLMHLGADVYVIGETITPAIESADLVVAISGSGSTKSVVDRSKKAHEIGCAILSVTTNPDSPLAEASDRVLLLPAATKQRRDGEVQSIQPLSSLFDQSTHIILDAICLEFSQLRTQTNDTARNRHSNLE